MSRITKYRTCNLCEAICGLEIEVENNQVVSIRGDKHDPFSQGHICPKAVALKDIHEDPDRLKKPIKKINGEWQEIGWQEAIDEVAQRLCAIQSQYGDNAVGIYQGNPSVHNMGTSFFSPNFVRSLKTLNRFSATSVDQLGHHLAGDQMFGHINMIPVPDIDHTDFWIIMGGNPIVSNGSLMTAPNVGKRLKAIQERGGKVITIDPRHTETSEKADQHIFIRPGTDIYLLLASINYILQNNKQKLNHLEDCVDATQIAAIQNLVSPYSIPMASNATGIDADVITTLINEYSDATRAVWYGRLGVSANVYGGLCHWAINVLNILTGHFDTPGGSMFTSPALNLANQKSRSKKFNRWQSRVDGLPETGGEFPSACMAEEILVEGEGQIRGFITSCGNPVLSVPNGNRLDQALESLDFMVSIDIYLNETTRHADIILPPATGLETPHYPSGFHNLAIRNTANYSAPVLRKEEGTLYDYEIFIGLQKAIEKIKLSEEEQKKNESYFQLTPELMLSMGLMSGDSGVTLEQLIQNPHGIDLGPLQSQLPKKLLTENQKINLLPEIYIKQIKTASSRIYDQSDQLLLVGRRHLRSNNSWLHNSYRMVKGRERCTLLIHPIDAQKRGINDGQKISVCSDVGEVNITAEITDEMMQGTVSIPHGWGHNRNGIKLKVAEDNAGVSMNDLIDNKLIDELTGVSIISGVPVDVKV